MNRFIKTFWLLLITVVVLSSCGRKKDPFGYMPADTQMVMSLNMPQLSEKMNFNAIRDETGLGMLSMMLSAQGIPNFIADRSVTGFDFEKPGYFYLFPQQDTATQIALLIPVEDSEKLETFLKKLDQSFKPEKESGITWGDLVMGQAGWTDKWMIFTFSPNALMTDEIRPVTELFDLSKNESITGSGPAEKIAGTSKDIHFWFNLARMDAMGEAEGVDLGNELALEGSVEFLDGEALLELTLQGDEATTTQWANLLGEGNPAALAKYLPKSGEQPAVLGLSLNPANILKWLEETGITTNLAKAGNDQRKAFIQLAASQMSESLNGQVLFAITDFPDAQPELDSFMEGEPGTDPMPFCVGFGLADRQAFEQFVLLQVSDSQLIRLNDGTYLFPKSRDSTRLALTEEATFITNQKDILANIQSGTETGGLDAETISKMGEHPLYGRLDVLGYAEAMTEMAGGSEGMMGMITGLAGAMSGGMEYAEWIADKPTAAGWKHTFRAQMIENSPNSLEIIVRQIVDGILGEGLFEMM